MSRAKCPACFRPAAYCYCAHVHKVVNTWPVFIVQDVRESRHPIGTARIAALSLGQAEMVVLNPEKPESIPDLLGEAFSRPLRNPALIYPGANARPVTDLSGDGPLAAEPRDLLFIDASWGRSLRLLNVFPVLTSLPKFALDGLPASRYRIRRQPSNDAMSTLEAIVYTLQQVEETPDFSVMLTTMDWIVDQQIKRMGNKVYRENYVPGPQ